ncbi:MAG: diacylglycerol kinase [Patescibacteria group bacterium]
MSANRLTASFKDAYHGVKFVFKHERNFRIQIFLAILTVIIGYFLGLKAYEWILVILLSALVLILELINTAMEKFLDVLKPRMHHFVAVIKDIMAAAVLLASIGAAGIALIIFVPKLIEYFRG